MCCIRHTPGPACRAQYLCACPPSAIKGEACGVTKQIQFETHKFILALKQYITQWSRVLRFGAPNHSKPSRAPVCSFTSPVISKTLRPLLFLGFRAGAICHPAGEISPPTYTYKGFIKDLTCLRDHSSCCRFSP
jgi:hypothetical protein